MLGFQQRQTFFEALQALLQEGGELVFLVGGFRPRDRRVAELPLQRGEQEQRVFAAMGFRDAAFLLREQDRRAGAVIGVAGPPAALFGEMFRAVIDHVGELVGAEPTAGLENPVSPGGVVQRIGGDGGHPFVISEPIPRQAFELIDEQAGGRQLLAAVFGFAFQDFESRKLIELRPIGLGLADDERLKRREIMGQGRHAVAHLALEHHLAAEHVHRQRQLRRGEDFFLQRGKDFLRRHAFRQPLAERAEEVGLLDVFFAV